MTETPVNPGLEVVLDNSRTSQDQAALEWSSRVCVYKTHAQDQHGTKCKLARVVAEIRDERLGQMVGQREAWPAARLSRVLALMGSPVSPTQIRDHRRGDCSCREEANAA